MSEEKAKKPASSQCRKCGGRLLYLPALQCEACELCGEAPELKPSVAAGLGISAPYAAATKVN